MRVVVTGSSGRMGRVCVRELLAHGHEVVGIDRGPAEDSTIQTHLIDLKNHADLAPIFQSIDCVCHLGNLPGFGANRGVSYADGYTNNVAATYNIFDAAYESGVRKFVYASSIQAYGICRARHNVPNLFTVPLYLPVDEDHPLLPRDAYPLSKATGEWIADSFVRRDPSVQVISLRLTGLRRDSDKGRHLHPDNPQDIAMAISGDLLAYTHVDDAAIVTRLCCEIDRPGHTALNIAAPKALAAWTEEIIQLAYGKLPEIRGSLRYDQPLLNIEKSRQILGFVAQRPPSGVDSSQISNPLKPPPTTARSA